MEKSNALMIAGAIAAGTFALPAMAGDAPQQPKIAEVEPAEEEQSKKTDAVLFEETFTSQGDSQSFESFISLFDADGKPYLKADFLDTEDVDTLKIAGRSKILVPGFEGTGEIIGLSTSENDYGIGFNGRGIIIGLFDLGIAAERKVTAGIAENLGMIYARKGLGDARVSLGVISLDDVVKGYGSADYVIGQNLAGLALSAGSGDYLATASLGRIAANKEDWGYRLWGSLDQDSNYMVDFIISTKSTISKGTVGAPLAVDDGVQDPKLLKNLMDASTYLWERTTPGGLALNLGLSDKNDALSFSADTLYRFPGRVSPMVGLGYSRADAADSVSGTLGLTWGPSYLALKGTGTEGEKPTFSAVAGIGVNF